MLTTDGDSCLCYCTTATKPTKLGMVIRSSAGADTFRYDLRNGFVGLRLVAFIELLVEILPACADGNEGHRTHAVTAQFCIRLIDVRCNG